ncbi:MAG: hypothetical protein HY066_09650 [Betaproteobacteria bacterium]|nr:hypothetical protein [Betaproteobacteria bacterium]
MQHYTLLTALMLATLAVQPVLADDAHHPEQKAEAAAPAADQTTQKMQVNAKRMQAQLEKMAKSKDPMERQKLMRENMQTMQANMEMGKDMMQMMMEQMNKSQSMSMPAK